MQVNKITTYVAIAIVGFVVALLYFLNDNNSNGYFFIFVTIYVLAGFRFFLEWKYYRHHGAILASLEFLLLPFTVILTAMIFSHEVSSIVLFRASLSIFQQSSMVFTLNVVSLLTIPAFLLFSRLVYFYHSKRWSGFAIRRKLFTTRKVPYLINSILAALLLVVGYSLSYFDAIASLVVVFWIYHSFKYYIFHYFRSSTPSSTSLVDNILTNQDTKRKRSTTSAGSRLREARIKQRSRLERSTHEKPSRNRQSIPASSRTGQRTVSTSYKGQKRIESLRAKSKQSTRSRSNINIDPGNEVKTLSANSKSSISGDLFPSGHILKEDLSCMFCYEEFKKTDKNIILCPYCKFPGHEKEFVSWIQVSDLCARCSKPLTKSQQTRPKYRLSAKQYIDRVINKL
jgi:DNA-directed RNA polymerase subunit RPC12/RpoP